LREENGISARLFGEKVLDKDFISTMKSLSEYSITGRLRMTAGLFGEEKYLSGLKIFINLDLISILMEFNALDHRICRDLNILA
jgi:hypothetical protein